MSMVLLSGHQIVLIDKVFHLLLWQQWRFKMAENENLIHLFRKRVWWSPFIFDLNISFQINISFDHNKYADLKKIMSNFESPYSLHKVKKVFKAKNPGLVNSFAKYIGLNVNFRSFWYVYVVIATDVTLCLLMPWKLFNA